MRVNEALCEMWKEGYFEAHKQVKEIDTSLLIKYGNTYSNTSVVLKRCGFLRKEKGGWIQKMRYSDDGELYKKQIDFFRLLQIHPEIEKVSKKLFLDKHFSQAIFEAFKKVNNLVKQKSGRKDLDGKSLMQHVFSVNNPTLKFNGLSSQSDKDEQEGFMNIYAGSILGIRNPKGHENIIQKDIYLTLEYLTLASLLCKKLEEAKKNT